MTDLPHARERLHAIADDLEADRLSPDKAADQIRDLMPIMTRSYDGERVTGRTDAFTPEMAKQIRAFKLAHPNMTQGEIATHFNVNQGRVSEALREA